MSNNYQSITWDADEKMWYRDGNVGDDGWYDQCWEGEQAATDILEENEGGMVYVYNKSGKLSTKFKVESN